MPVADLSEAELDGWGAAYAATLPPDAWVAISGPLGAGKTTLVRAMARALGVTEPVTSPTYALVHEYTGARGSVFHLDLYRLDSPAQLPQLGWDDLVGGHHPVLVEWPERAGDRLPAHRALALDHIAGQPDRRRLTWPG